jgi:hypothetical protein
MTRFVRSDSATGARKALSLSPVLLPYAVCAGDRVIVFVE